MKTDRSSFLFRFVPIKKPVVSFFLLLFVIIYRFSLQSCTNEQTNGRMDKRTNSQYFNQWILIDNHFPSSRGGNFSFHSGNVPAGYYRTRYKWPKWMFDDKSCIVVSLRCNCTTRLHENSVCDTVVRPRSVSNFRKYRRDLCFERIYSRSRFIRSHLISAIAFHRF